MNFIYPLTKLVHQGCEVLGWRKNLGFKSCHLAVRAGLGTDHLHIHQSGGLLQLACQVAIGQDAVMRDSFKA